MFQWFNWANFWIHQVSKDSLLLDLLSPCLHENFRKYYIWMESCLSIEFLGHNIFPFWFIYNLLLFYFIAFAVDTVSCLPSIYWYLFSDIDTDHLFHPSFLFPPSRMAEGMLSLSWAPYSSIMIILLLLGTGSEFSMGINSKNS